MAGENSFGRRSFITRTVAVSTGIAVAGCGGLGGGGSESIDVSFGEPVDGDVTGDSPRDPRYDDLAEPFSFTGAAGDVVDISMSSDDFDTYLVLLGPDKSVVGENDDYGSTTDSRVIRGLDEDAEYTIWAGSLDGEATGSFSLSLSRTESSLLVPDDAQDLSGGGTSDGTLTSDSPLDPLYGDPSRPYTVEATEGDSLSVTMSSEEIDSYLVITNERGQTVAENDNGGAGTNSSLTTTLSEAGTYVIWAQSGVGSEVGSFELTLSN